MQLHLSPLYYRHALIQLIILPMQQAQILTDETLSATIACIYQHCLDYMEAFVSLLPPSILAKCSNLTFISTSYIVVLSLKMTKLSKPFSFIEPATLLQYAASVVAAINTVPSLRYHQTAAMYGNLLGRLFDQCRQGTPASASVPVSASIEPDTQQSSEYPPVEALMSIVEPRSDEASFFLDDVELMAWANYHFASNVDFAV